MKIIVINGRGSSGKDKTVDYITDLLEEDFVIWNYSSIDPIKKAAKSLGWKGTKTPRDRKFLSNLKQVCIEYNDYPTKYLIDEIKYLNELNKMQEADDDIVFVHIREPLEIKKFVNAFEKTITLYVARHEEDIGNVSDDGVGDYDYDYILDNTSKWKYTVSNIKEWLRRIGVEDKYIEQGDRRSRE